ncbi:GNAT family N-acetyltransferase [Clostridium sp. CM028]|uniref:GNAT family N-acetyltransferase n=1 Tax=Clostridium sp. CM028 TaxID=2851575 RepID=UPI001C6F53D2|nr:GNAT family N-acetyltransferase [Clostridium sp. CM028]MBW9150622.1 GNAT family N-acetyltransferase [Clostridium sp. CM028]WLC62796.1 GNAT family N-acetyltransferase [Clostridium sp. CM028]
MRKEKYIIREIKETELDILEMMLFGAIYLPVGSEPLTREVLKIPEISVYIDDFLKKKDDHCLVADVDGIIIGAVWVRILAGEIKGYGNIDDKTPEFSISLIKEYQNQGIGTSLMKKMIEYLKEKGYSQTSLSVSKGNYAVRMYKAVGFEIIAEKKDDYLMLLKLI